MNDEIRTGTSVRIIEKNKTGIVVDTYTEDGERMFVVETGEFRKSSNDRIRYTCTKDELELT